MRNIKYRGKCAVTGKLIYGYGVILCEDIAQVIHKQGNNIMQHTNVLPDTIGQYIGRTDVAGNAIFEGQQVNVYKWGIEKGLLGTGVIVFDESYGCWQTNPMIVEDQYDFFTKAKIEVLD